MSRKTDRARQPTLNLANAPAGSISVTQLTAMIRAALQRSLPQRLLVVGELSNVSRPASGHVYFTLKDSGSEVRCAMWRSAAAYLRFDPVDGLAVLVTGAIDVYEPRGQVQLYAQRIEPIGIGALELAFRQLKEKLERLGLFDPARKRPLPFLPRRIALVSSPTGAAVRDMIQTIRRRCPSVELLIHPVRVQGDGAAAEIAAAIRAVNRDAGWLGGIDVMIVGRGGGSLEDLWAFNEEVVAQAIFDSRIPVVSAVGHEVDVTIADLVADVRAATPTAAAELVVPVRAELLEHLDRLAGRLRRAADGRLDLLRMRLARAASLELFRQPQAWLMRHDQRVDELAARLRSAVERRLAAHAAAAGRLEMRLHRVRPEAQMARRRERLAAIEHRLMWAQGHANVLAERRLSQVLARLIQASPRRIAQRESAVLGQLRVRLSHAIAAQMSQRATVVAHMASRLAAGSHEQVLRRGFTITRRRDGTIVTTPVDVREGDRVTTRTAGGEFNSRVIDGRQGELFE